MNVLDDLKKQAEKILKGREQATGQHQSLQEFQHSEVLSSLDRIHHYLIELLEQLRIVDPDIHTDFTIEGVGILAGLVQKNYRLYTEDTFSELTIGLNFILQCENEKKELRNLEPQFEGKLHNKLSYFGLEVSGEATGQPEIKGHVSSSLMFKSDYQKNLIHLSINNVENNVLQAHEIEPANVNNKLLNELGSYLLRRKNSFIHDIINQEQQSQHIQEFKNQVEETEPTLTEMMNTSLVNNLFRERQHLYLTYREKIRDLGTRDKSIIVGRSSKCNLSIDSECASRQHALFVYRKGKFIVTDKSTNGTFIKPQGGKEIYIHGEDYPLSGSGFISLGEAVSVDNEHLIYYSCQ